jgi:hypothetical protein
MTPADYLTRAGAAFLAPVHPGPAPIQLPNPTAAQITETNRQYTADLAEHSLFRTVEMELKKQILACVPALYLNVLADRMMGFADVSCVTMVEHLRSKYDIITADDLEANCTRLSEPWNPDSSIESLWLRIREIQDYAVSGHEEITNATAICLTLVVIENTGVYIVATGQWRQKPYIEWTMPSFQIHFEQAATERTRQLTAQTAGFYGAHAANANVPPPPPRNANTNSHDPALFAMTCGMCVMYYCWSHGLSSKQEHTSLTCRNKKDGHMDNATLANCMGGSRMITDSQRTTPCPPRPSQAPTPANARS